MNYVDSQSETFRWKLALHMLSNVPELFGKLVSPSASIPHSTARTNPKSLESMIGEAFSLAGRFHILSRVSTYEITLLNSATKEFESKCNEVARSLEDWAGNAIKVKVGGEPVSSLQDQFSKLIPTLHTKASELSTLALKMLAELNSSDDDLRLDTNEDRYVSITDLVELLGSIVRTKILKVVTKPPRVCAPKDGHGNGHWYSLKEIWKVLVPHLHLVKGYKQKVSEWKKKLPSMSGRPDDIRFVDPNATNVNDTSAKNDVRKFRKTDFAHNDLIGKTEPRNQKNGSQAIEFLK